jgi:hypothetical protein
MILLEALYGQRCITQVNWYNLRYIVVIGPYLLKEMEEQMTKIRKNLKVD